MPACYSLVNTSYLARLKTDPKLTPHVHITREAYYGEGLFLIQVESERALPGRHLQVIVLEEDGVRFSDDLDT